jgi:hypothetical protein
MAKAREVSPYRTGLQNWLHNIAAKKVSTLMACRLRKQEELDRKRQGFLKG